MRLFRLTNTVIDRKYYIEINEMTKDEATQKINPCQSISSAESVFHFSVMEGTMIFLKLLSKFIGVLRSGAKPGEIAWGFALGAVLGLTPFRGAHTVIVILLICVLRVNVSAAVFSWLVFSLLAYLLDPVFHSLGFAVLTGIPALIPFWTSLYNAPIAPLTRFNNTVLMGSLVVSVLLLVPNFLFFKWFVVRYRESWNAKVKKLKLVQSLNASSLVQWYFKVRELGG